MTEKSQKNRTGADSPATIKTNRMNALSTISILSAWIGLTILNISDSTTAKQVATLFGLVAVGTIVIAVVCHVRTAIGLQVREASTPTSGTRDIGSIPPEQGTARRTAQGREAAAQPPTPSYGTGEISPISAPVGSKPLEGMSFALTGKMPVKRAKMECLIEYFGGTVHKRIRKDTDFLVVGESREVSGKESKANRWNTPTLDVAELAKMIGITYYDIRDRYFEVVPAEVAGARIMSENTRREVRQYNKVAGEQRTLLKSFMEMRPDITLPHPVQVIVSTGDEMELATIDRLKFNQVGDYILYSTDGEALYLDDLRDCSVSDIIGVLAA